VLNGYFLYFICEIFSTFACSRRTVTLLGKGKILSGGKTAIGAHLTRRSAELLFVPFEQILITVAVGRVAPLDQAVQDQIGDACRLGRPCGHTGYHDAP